MKKTKIMALLLSATLVFSGCGNMNNTAKGGLIGGGWMRSHVRSNGASCAVDRMVSQKRSSGSTTGL